MQTFPEKSLRVLVIVVLLFSLPLISNVYGLEIRTETEEDETIYLEIDWRTDGRANWEIDGHTYEEERYLYHFLGTSPPGPKEIVFEPAQERFVRRIIWPRRKLVNHTYEGLPENIEGLGEHLNRLNLRENKFDFELDEVADQLGVLNRLTRLRLDNNQIEGEIPGEIFEEFERLEVLDLHRNEIEGEIPEELGLYSDQLMRLSLHDNKLTGFEDAGNLEDFFQNLADDLKVITLKNNKFEEVPSEITYLENIKELNLRNNDLEQLFSVWEDPENIEIDLNELEHLRADQNVLGLSGEPENIFPYEMGEEDGLESMIEMDRLYTRFYKQWVPRNITVDLRYNNIEKLPETIGGLLALESLHLDKSGLEGFYDEDGEFVVDGDGNRKLPIKLGELSHYDGDPSELEVREAAEILDFIIFSIADNKFEGYIPEDIPRDWENIKTIRLENNLFDGDLAEDFFQLEKLEVFNLENNLFGQDSGSLEADGLFGSSSMSASLLRELYAGRNYFVEIEDNFQAPNLEYFQLEENELDDLGSDFGSGLENLLSLSLYKNRFEELPESFGSMSSLEYLDLGTNVLERFPEEITDLTELDYLNISRQSGNPEMNRFELQGEMEGEVPDEITNLSQLVTFLLSNNELETLPEEGWGGMGELVFFQAQNNELVNLPPEMGNLANLEWLYLNNNQVEDNIDDNLTNTSELERFYIQYNNEDKEDKASGGVSGSLPQNSNWNNLERFLADANQIEGGLHDQFLQNLSFLEHLSLYRNEMDGEIGDRINVMRELVWWDLGLNFERRSEEGLTGEIPDTVGALGELKVFDFNNNQITEVPDEINQLSNLISLLGFENDMIEFAQDIGNLTNLRHLDFHNAYVGNNIVTDFPDGVENLSDLKYFSFGENEKMGGDVPWGEWEPLPEDALFLNNNELEGDIPDDLHTKSSDMVFLNIRSNEFEGGYPTQ